MANKSPVKPRRRFSLFHREEGQSSFEFLVVLPLFIVFFLGLVDLGIMTYQYVSVSNAVREGARFGAVTCGDGSCTEADVKTRTIIGSGGILSDPEDRPEVTVRWLDNDIDGTPNGKGDSVIVLVDHQYDFMFFPGHIHVKSCADMRLEQNDGTLNPPTGSGC